MFDTKTELLERIRLGESSFLEFKEVKFKGKKIEGPHRNSLADGLSAFANSRGGVFVLGVADSTREVVGVPLERLDAVVDFVRNVCMDSVDPALEHVIVDRLLLPSSTGEEVAVVKVDVPRSLFVHRSPGGYLHRVADSKRPISPALLARLFDERGQQHVVPFNEQPVPQARMEDLNPSLWSRFMTPRSGEDGAVFLAKLGMAELDEDGLAKPTVAGVLMASDNPRRWLPQRLRAGRRVSRQRHPGRVRKHCLSTRRLGCHRPTGSPSCGRLSLCGQEHENRRVQVHGAHGPAAIRHGGRL